MNISTITFLSSVLSLDLSYSTKIIRSLYRTPQPRPRQTQDWYVGIYKYNYPLKIALGANC